MRALAGGLTSCFTAALSSAPAFAQEAPAYVGSAACAPCHTEATAAWEGSHHAWAWTEPTEDRVLADFDGTAFEGAGMSVRFSRSENGDYLVDVTEADGSNREYPVHSVAGVAPLQQYLLETEPGRLQSFDVVWDTEKGGWFHLYPDQVLMPDDGLHWTGPYKTWNARCAECHATDYEKAYDPATRSYVSTQAEIGVGCEACHGPGAAHLDWAEGRSFDAAGLSATGLTIDYAGGQQAQIDGCAGCHARRETFTDGSPLPGTPFHDSYRLATLRPGLYHADGQILEEVYVTGSFLQSKMYEAGVSCTDCHDAHSATRIAEGTGVCTSCHAPEGDDRFPQAAGLYDDPSHHFHPMGSKGAQCRNCHMIEQVYMGNDGRRDHSFRIPRPDLAAETGAPDTCTACHIDRDPAWAAAEIAERFGPPAGRPIHYGRILAASRARPGVETAALAALARDPDRPGIVRATALDQIAGSASPALADTLADLLRDPDPLVRAAAVAVQRGTAPADRTARLMPLVSDPVRAVRIAAARQMLDAPLSQASPGEIEALRAAYGEWQESLKAKADFPEAHMAIGGGALVMRNTDAASAAFAEAVRLDPQQVQAWSMLVRIAAALGDEATARARLAEARAANPDDPTLAALAAQLP
ncbi:MAG: multiheme c-type cytochrome [Pseudomonadota bacterium]